MMETILEMKKITKIFPGVRALDEVDFDLRKGEIHALIGENGAGKSTLMKALLGMYEIDGGEIWFKTDDTPLFTESLPYFEACGFEMRYLTSDLHAAGFEPNYVSEHEQKFTALGVPIKFVIMRKKPGPVELNPVRWVMPGAFARLREGAREEEDTEETIAE